MMTPVLLPIAPLLHDSLWKLQLITLEKPQCENLNLLTFIKSQHWNSSQVQLQINIHVGQIFLHMSFMPTEVYNTLVG